MTCSDSAILEAYAAAFALMAFALAAQPRHGGRRAFLARRRATLRRAAASAESGAFLDWAVRLGG